MLKPVNDYCQIKLDEAGAFSAKAGDAATSGILVAVPEAMTHFGMYSSMLDTSFMAHDQLDEVLEEWRQYIGKRVFWLALSEKGAILEDSTGKYALIKMSSLMAMSEADERAESVTDSKGGAFSV